MPDLVLDVHDLHVGYGKVEALHGASIQIRSGQIVTVIGPNGAGNRPCSTQSWVVFQDVAR